MEQIEMCFKGYYWNNFSFPEKYGIYGIYKTKKNSQGEYIVDELVYIGLSDNIRRRINEHSNNDYSGEKQFCYIYCELPERKAKYAEAAIINECKPKGNTEYVVTYPKDFKSVQLVISGQHKYIPDRIKKI